MTNVQMSPEKGCKKCLTMNLYTLHNTLYLTQYKVKLCN